jgi:hypothetical protein
LGAGCIAGGGERADRAIGRNDDGLSGNSGGEEESQEFHHS